VVHSRFVNGAWTAPVTTGIQSDLSPALVSSTGGKSLELLSRGLDRTVQHGRFINGAWVAPLSLGITTDARPALVASADAGLDAAVAATDGRIYASHFAGTPPPAPDPAPTPSFSRDILRIFTNNGPKTCAQPSCHAGRFPQAGMDLEASQAYNNIVNVTSTESRGLKRILPGNADKSYLYQKVSSGQMPLAGGRLTAADIDLIRQWINAGAPNN
jgi:hypothetical protein